MNTRTLGVLLGLGLLAACDPKEGDTSSDGGATDGGTPADCDTSNESCAPGTCEGEGPDMLPGSNCLACHSPGNYEEDEDDAFWSVGGTVFTDLDGTDGASGVIVRVTDSLGTMVQMSTSAAGNFYSRDALTPPLTAEIEVDGVTIAMGSEVETGACNTCHSCDGEAGGKIYPP